MPAGNGSTSSIGSFTYPDEFIAKVKEVLPMHTKLHQLLERPATVLSVNEVSRQLSLCLAAYDDVLLAIERMDVVGHPKTNKTGKVLFLEQRDKLAEFYAQQQRFRAGMADGSYPLPLH